MHKKSHHLPSLATLSVAAVCLWCLTAPAGAGPIVLQDAKQSTEAVVDTSKLATMEPTQIDADAAPNWDKSAAPSGKAKESAKPGVPPLTPANQTAPAGAGAVPAAAANVTGTTTLDKDIHTSIKETVRPVYDQLVESGAVEALHDVKESLGLNKNQWDEQGKADGQNKAPGQWDTPETNQPPKTEAQARMDREMATMMREKLVDQITPWVIGLVVLYIVGYLVKVLYGYVRWKAVRRSERRISHAKRQAARRSRNASSGNTAKSHTEPGKTG